MSEPSLAISAIQRWRQAVLEEHRQWESQVEVLEAAYETEVQKWKQKLKKWEEKEKQATASLFLFVFDQILNV